MTTFDIYSLITIFIWILLFTGIFYIYNLLFKEKTTYFKIYLIVLLLISGITFLLMNQSGLFISFWFGNIVSWYEQHIASFLSKTFFHSLKEEKYFYYMCVWIFEELYKIILWIIFFIIIWSYYKYFKNKDIKIFSFKNLFFSYIAAAIWFWITENILRVIDILWQYDFFSFLLTTITRISIHISFPLVWFFIYNLCINKNTTYTMYNENISKIIKIFLIICIFSITIHTLYDINAINNNRIIALIYDGSLFYIVLKLWDTFIDVSIEKLLEKN